MDPGNSLQDSSTSAGASLQNRQTQPRPDQCEYAFKVIILGDSGVGKTSLYVRHKDNYFLQQLSTCGLDLMIKTTSVSGRSVCLMMWDTGGQERFGCITKSFVRESDAVLLAYDVTKRDSFKNIHKWFEFAGNAGAEGAVKLLVGCKEDLKDQREVSYVEGETLARRLGIDFFETSAKTCVNVSEVFNLLLVYMLPARIRSEIRGTARTRRDTITLTQPEDNGNSGSRGTRGDRTNENNSRCCS